MISKKTELADKQWKVLKAITEGLSLENTYLYTQSLDNLAEKATVAKADIKHILQTLEDGKAIEISTVEIRDKDKYDKFFSSPIPKLSFTSSDSQSISGKEVQSAFPFLDGEDKVNILLGKKFDKIFAQLENKFKPNKDYHFPHKLPAGTLWQHMIIKFLDDENVHIEVLGKKTDVDFRGMGFEDKKTGKPNAQWIFFKILAKLNGEITLKDSEARAKYKKTKQLLSDTLKRYFIIADDPFYNYKIKNIEKENNSYKIRMSLFYNQDSMRSVSPDEANPNDQDPRLIGMEDMLR